jgi:1,4-dihydroxy-2-naphthoate octaprenyltransferase
MNFKMWKKALQVIPRISKEEWDGLDVVSRWLVATRAAVLIITFIPAVIAGLLAAKDGMFHTLNWLLLTVGLVFAHAMNNLLNDLTDYRRGVDKDNYFRTQYGPQPLESGLMTTTELLNYAAFNGVIALVCGVALTLLIGWPVLILVGLGAFFVFFYTWPLKYIGLGEISVILVWGPLMVGGGYYAITGIWNWQVCLASLPYALGAALVIFGKHIDKLPEDKTKGIHTLPVILGEKTSRTLVLVMIALQYLLVVYLVFVGYFSPVLLVVFLALIKIRPVVKIFLAPKPAERPADYSAEIWPLWFVAAGFYHNRIFGMYLMLGLILQLPFFTSLFQSIFR